MNSSVSSPGSMLRSAWSWVLLPPAAWLVSIPFLEAGAFFIPIVIAQAPLGIIGYFQKITVSPTTEQKTTIVAIHAGFWLLFITGLSLRRVLPPFWLQLIWLVIVGALFYVGFRLCCAVGSRTTRLRQLALIHTPYSIRVG